MSEAGVIGAFASAEELIEAVRQAPVAGFAHWETFTPSGPMSRRGMTSTPLSSTRVSAMCFSSGDHQ